MSGQLIVEKDYTDNRFGLLKENNQQADTVSHSFCDPLNLSSQFFAMLKNCQRIKVPLESETQTKPKTKSDRLNSFEKMSKVQNSVSLTDIFTAFKCFNPISSREVTFALQHSKKFPLTIVLIYKKLPFEIAEFLSQRILESFVYKYERKLVSKGIVFGFYTKFDKVLLSIFEDVLLYWIKDFAIQLFNLNMYIPWIFIFCQNPEDQLCSPNFSQHHKHSTNRIIESVSQLQGTTTFTKKLKGDSVAEDRPGARLLLEPKGESLTDNILRYEQCKKAKIGNMSKISRKFTSKKFKMENYKADEEIRDFEYFVRFETEELKQDHNKSGDVTNELLLVESHEINIKKAENITGEGVKSLKELIINANSMMSFCSSISNTGTYKPVRHIQLSLNKNHVLLCKSKLLVLIEGNLFIAIPIETLNEKANLLYLSLNKREFITQLEKFITFLQKRIAIFNTPK